MIPFMIQGDLAEKELAASILFFKMDSKFGKNVYICMFIAPIYKVPTATLVETALILYI
jgi:hypothetical protein